MCFPSLLDHVIRPHLLQGYFAKLLSQKHNLENTALKFPLIIQYLAKQVQKRKISLCEKSYIKLVRYIIKAIITNVNLCILEYNMLCFLEKYSGNIYVDSLSSLCWKY